MDAVINEGFVTVLDTLALKNRRAIVAWEERLWRNKLRTRAPDPRDERGRRAYREHEQRVRELRALARQLHRRRAG